MTLEKAIERLKMYIDIEKDQLSFDEDNQDILDDIEAFETIVDALKVIGEI